MMIREHVDYGLQPLPLLVSGYSSYFWVHAWVHPLAVLDKI
ncbi:hypothetical protein [Salmonella enterica]|nr:hypothetical protein [Salmonella enterica]